jgi:ABC-type sugar transport system ATPase subunit
MARIDLERLSKVFPGGVTAVRQVSLTVTGGELLVLLGPSGCGKTTLLRLIAGLERPTSGEVRLDGREVNGLPPTQRDVAMVFQSHALYPHLTVRRNLAFAAELREGVGRLRQWLWRLVDRARAADIARRRQEIAGRVTETARLLGLGGLLQRRAWELSGGERQRVALGRAMVRRPGAMLLDEPLSDLDAPLRTEMRRELKQLHRECGWTCLFVTHDQAEALTLGDRLAVMHQGEIVQVGTPEDIYRRPRSRFVASFVGSPPMSFWEGELKGHELRVSNWPLPHDRAKFGSKDSGQVLIGIRAEAVQPLPREAGAEVPRWTANVSMVEHGGDTVVLHLENVRGGAGDGAGQAGDGAGQRLTAKWSAQQWNAAGRVGEGDPTLIAIDPGGIDGFEPVSGENLGLP